MNPILELRSHIARALTATAASKLAYKGERVVFIFLKTHSFQVDSAALVTLLRNTLVTPPGEEIGVIEDVHLFPERELSVSERLAFTSSVLKEPRSSHIIVTSDPFLMTDALPSSTVVVEMSDHAWTILPGAFPAFASDPGRIAHHLSGTEGTIGDLAKTSLEEWVAADWTNRAPELWHLLDQIGGGNRREPLVAILDELSAKASPVAA